ncbi:hypothetical protein [Sandaracinus amylolyticus]|uniref:hypothetical protein n=1 Tax=Sandaracinus amylolyticus TaxID=927083 RepID=UPI001F47AB52|nr:hypothetical protein [Sandaracinus amylolyticus]UJR83635.1 Hypothetical protein I5071_57040 [Sandaracinus amylolyticus]
MTGRWMGTKDAARVVGIAQVTLRRMLERAARRANDGTIEAKLEGLVGRKLGHRWRVALDARWQHDAPTPGK